MISARENLSIRRRKISIFLFTFGAALGMVLIGASVYADFESTLFDATTIVDSAVRPINCPVLLSTSEKGKVSAVIRNSTDVRRELVVRAHITRGHLILIRELEDRITLDPGESLRFKWEVTPQDAAYGHLILAKVIVLNEGPQGTHKGSCGIIVLNLPDHVRGGQLFWLLYSLSSIGVLGGMTIWRNHGRSSAGRLLEATRSIFGLGGIILGGMLCIAIGLWELAAIAFYIGLLLIGVIVPHFLITR